MLVSINLEASNAVVLIEDYKRSVRPVSLDEHLFASTASCIAVACRAPVGEQTEVAIASAGRDRSWGRLLFNGEIDTPSRRLAVRTVAGEELLEFTVDGKKTKLRVRINEGEGPERIEVELC